MNNAVLVKSCMKLADTTFLHLPTLDFDTSLGSELVVSTTLFAGFDCDRLSSSIRTAAKPPGKKDTTDPSATGFPEGFSAGIVATSSGTKVD